MKRIRRTIRIEFAVLMAFLITFRAAFYRRFMLFTWNRVVAPLYNFYSRRINKLVFKGAVKTADVVITNFPIDYHDDGEMDVLHERYDYPHTER